MNLQNNVNDFLKRNKLNLIFANFNNPEIVKLEKYLKGDIVPSNCFVTEGMWCAKSILKHHINVTGFVFNPESIYSQEGLSFVETMINKKVPVYVISSKTLNKISNRNDDNGVYCICEMPKYELNKLENKENAIVVILDGIEKPGNIGTILRTCDAVCADAVFICNKRAKINNMKCVKGSMGAFFHIPIFEFNSVEECYAWLKKERYSVYLADTRANVDYYKTNYDKRVALVMGSERYGISKTWCEVPHTMIKLPMLGECDSLNVGVATSVFLYDIKMKQIGE